MTYDEYIGIVKAELPELPVDDLINSAKMDMDYMITMVAVQLFMLNECDTPLAVETRRQLVFRKQNGIIDFD